MRALLGEDASQWTAALLEQRRTVLPKRLSDSGPTESQKALILQAAASAPDHDQIRPWRWLEIPSSHRTELAQVFEDALLERDPSASPDERSQAREKSQRAPWLLMLVVRTRGEPEGIPACERLLSAGAAAQNMLLMATALGFGSSLTSGKALQSQALRQRMGLSALEDAVCFLNVGEVASHRKPRPRPQIADYFSVWG